MATKMIKDMKHLYKKRLQYLGYFSLKRGDMTEAYKIMHRTQRRTNSVILHQA